MVDGIKEHLRNESIIYSFIPTIPRQKICALLSHQFVIQTEYEWNESCDADTIITDSLDVVQALENDSVLLLSCPLGSALKGIIYYYDCVFACSSKQWYAFQKIQIQAVLVNSHAINHQNQILTCILFLHCYRYHTYNSALLLFSVNDICFVFLVLK